MRQDPGNQHQDTPVLPDVLAALGYRLHTSNTHTTIIAPVCVVPAGPFLMGSNPRRDPEAWPIELPQHRVETVAYEIAMYPVTVAEYACAIQAGAVQVPQGSQGAPWTQWSNQLQTPDYPVVMLSWSDAVTYAQWLAEMTTDRWRLPTEAEWEKAARGPDARIYPWGDVFDPRCANTDESSKGTVTPIDAYPSGRSPYGLLDMVGNTYEWCSSSWQPYPYDPNDGREVMAAEQQRRIARGGCFYDYANNARAATRWPLQTHGRRGPIGMRLVRETGQ